MASDIKESDWRVFKQLHPIALERYFMRSVAAMQRKLGNERKTNRERFWEIVENAREDQKEVREVFDGSRRSTAMLQLLRMRSEGLLLPEEMSRFSPELRESVENSLGSSKQ